MAIVGGASIGLGLGVAATGIPRIGVIGVRAFFRTAAKGAVVEASHEGALGVQAGLSAFLPGAGLSIHSIREAQRNEDRLNAAKEDCKEQFPNANHALSSLNF